MIELALMALGMFIASYGHRHAERHGIVSAWAVLVCIAAAAAGAYWVAAVSAVWAIVASPFELPTVAHVWHWWRNHRQGGQGWHLVIDANTADPELPFKWELSICEWRADRLVAWGFDRHPPACIEAANTWIRTNHREDTTQ